MKQTLIWIAVIVIAGLLVWFLGTQMTQDVPPTQEEAGEVQGEDVYDGDTGKDAGVAVEAGITLGDAAVIRYTDSGFVPSSLTVAPGTTVTFVNESGGKMWVGANDHPTHTSYAGTSKDVHCPDPSGAAFDQCAVGDSFTFTFMKVGEWGYHNHTQSSHKGTIVVE